MAGWVLVPCLVELREEFNLLAPERDHASDGSIGNAAHARESSDHNPDETGATPYEDADNLNEVHAIDVDDDLRKPGWDMQRCVDIIVGRHRAGDDDRLQNVIYNRRIWSRSWGWAGRPYTGTSAHTEHAHFSARYLTATEADRRPWGLLEGDEMTKDQLLAALTEWAKSPAGSEAICKAVFLRDNVIPAPYGTDPADPNQFIKGSAYLRGTYDEAKRARALLEAQQTPSGPAGK